MSRHLDLNELITSLPERHQEALLWFAERAGETHPWPQPLEREDERTFLASKAKGIYKPSWSEYALSVRETLGGPYPDRKPVERPDGTWSYAYFQENKDPSARDAEFTNRGLVACWRDRVPVGVMRQVSGRPNVGYHILGLALVSSWDAGYFFFEGFSRDGSYRGRGPGAQIDLIAATQETAQVTAGTFYPNNVVDARERTIGAIVHRRGQPAFRNALLELYNGRCAITGSDVVEALEAAHITPYRGPDTNHPANGLLLHSDIHVLFDLGLVGVDPLSKRVVVAPALSGTTYENLKDRLIAEPLDPNMSPSEEALAEHLRWAGLRASAKPLRRSHVEAGG